MSAEVIRSSRSRNTGAAAEAANLLHRPLTVLKGVGPGNAAHFTRLGIHTVYDLLWHLPLRYQDRSRLVPISALEPGREALFQGEVVSSEVRFGRRRMLLVVLSDGEACITLRFFHFSSRQQAGLAEGVWLRCYGEVRAGGRAQVSLPIGTDAPQYEAVHPEYSRIAAHAPLPPAETDTLTPVYPATEGISQVLMRKVTAQAVALLKQLPDGYDGLDLLPVEWLQSLGMPALGEALCEAHFPSAEQKSGSGPDQTLSVRRRLALEELTAQQLGVRRARHARQGQPACVLSGGEGLFERLLDQLPFFPTAAQRRVIDEIYADLARPQPMMRLIQGDVGSGKTLVAAAAVLQAVACGRQAVIMAPTEILAEQHYRNFCRWMTPLGIETALLSGRLPTAQRHEVLAAIGQGTAQLVVGTHALFREAVDFASPGLVVVDEQHRFGVHQRLALRDKGANDGAVPHQLIMTATPIPRTMVMTAYADLDCSVIDELPPGRQPIQTVTVSSARRDEVLARVRLACERGQQAYWVCTLVEESDVLQCQAAEETAQFLSESLSPLGVGLIHGRMKAQDKEQVMLAFRKGELDVLVATTVIEVGVDVPNASLMIIEDADRLGLAQLHQLRGRVGRGAVQSSCVLMYSPPLSGKGRERLSVLRETNDGFEVAQRDLALRGPGEILGTRQAGEQAFRVADSVQDQDLVMHAAELAERLLAEYPQRVAPLVSRWLGDSLRYVSA